MAREIARLLRTDVMGDLSMPAIAQLLQSQGRGRDTILAHITPQEAALLRKIGGRGSQNPTTGLPEFEPEDGMGFDDQADTSTADIPPPAETGIAAAQQIPDVFAPQTVDLTADAGVAPPPTVEYAPPLGSFPSGGDLAAAFPTPETPLSTYAAEGAPVGPVDQAKQALDKLSQAEKLRLALGLSGAGIGAITSRRAAQQGQAAKRDLQAIGAPYQQQGREMQAAAMRGELTAANQQAIQAAQAQLAQSSVARGGVGAVQAANQLANLRATMLQNQFDYGLKVANIGDQIVQGAIRTGLQADQAVQQATRNFYAQMASIAGGIAK